MCTALKKGQYDEKRRLQSFVLGIVIGGENIDWSLPGSVEHVCDILGVKKSKVYNVRKSGPVEYARPKRQRRSHALDKQPWLPQASAVMETFWEQNCDESPDADNPAVLHDFTCKDNHRYDPLPDNPDKTIRVCVGLCLYTQWFFTHTFK